MTLESSKEELHKLRERLREGIASGKYTAHEVQTALVRKSRRAAAVTDAYVHENAWKSVGAAALGGLVVGALLAGASGDRDYEVEEYIPRERARESDFNILDMLQTAMPLVVFGLKAYTKLQQHRRNSTGPVI